jgi:hypothetical protein
MDHVSTRIIGIMAALRDYTGTIPMVYSYPDCVVFKGRDYSAVVDREDGLIRVAGDMGADRHADLIYTVLGVLAPEALDYTQVV